MVFFESQTAINLLPKFPSCFVLVKFPILQRLYFMKNFPKRVFRTVIPRNVRLSEAPSFGETILTYSPSSAGALAYSALTDELLVRENDRAVLDT